MPLPQERSVEKPQQNSIDAAPHQAHKVNYISFCLVYVFRLWMLNNFNSWIGQSRDAGALTSPEAKQIIGDMYNESVGKDDLLPDVEEQNVSDTFLLII